MQSQFFSDGRQSDRPSVFSSNFRRILGIDPGFASTGWGIVDVVGGRLRCVAYGVVGTTAQMLHELRLKRIFDGISAAVKQFSPTEAAMEELFFARNVTSALTVAEARGVLQLCLVQNGVAFRQFKPNSIKLSVCGIGSAEKIVVQNCVRMLLRLDELPKPDHAADALAAAITAANTPWLHDLNGGDHPSE